MQTRGNSEGVIVILTKGEGKHLGPWGMRLESFSISGVFTSSKM